jgi:hypothetical protein
MDIGLKVKLKCSARLVDVITCQKVEIFGGYEFELVEESHDGYWIVEDRNYGKYLVHDSQFSPA